MLGDIKLTIDFCLAVYIHKERPFYKTLRIVQRQKKRHHRDQNIFCDNC